jgi:hypothetical protein
MIYNKKLPHVAGVFLQNLQMSNFTTRALPIFTAEYRWKNWVTLKAEVGP